MTFYRISLDKINKIFKIYHDAAKLVLFFDRINKIFKIYHDAAKPFLLILLILSKEINPV